MISLFLVLFGFNLLSLFSFEGLYIMRLDKIKNYATN